MALSAICAHGMVAKSVRVSERNSVVLASIRTQAILDSYFTPTLPSPLPTLPNRMHLNIYQKYESSILAFSQSAIYGLLIIKKWKFSIWPTFFMTAQCEGVKR